jgi:hypothetical protein
LRREPQPGILPSLHVLDRFDPIAVLYQYDQLNSGILGTEQLPPEPLMFLRDIPDHLPEVMLPVDYYFWMAYDLIVAHIKLLADMDNAVPVEVVHDPGDSLGVLASVDD